MPPDLVVADPDARSFVSYLIEWYQKIFKL